MSKPTLAQAIADILSERCPQGVAPNVARFAVAHSLVRGSLYRRPKYGYRADKIKAVAEALEVPETRLRAKLEGCNGKPCV